MFRATAVITTDASVRYAKQLLAHLGHKVTVEPLEGQPQAGRLVFAYGAGTVVPMDGRLVLDATAQDAESLARVEDVLARHLVKFGARRELTVSWQSAADGAVGPDDGAVVPVEPPTGADQPGRQQV